MTRTKKYIAANGTVTTVNLTAAENTYIDGLASKELERRRALKLSALKTRRDSQEHPDRTHTLSDGKTILATTQNVTILTQKLVHLEHMTAGSKLKWKYDSGEIVELEASDVEDLLKEIDDVDQAIHEDYWTKKAEIEALTTVAAIDAYDITA